MASDLPCFPGCICSDCNPRPKLAAQRPEGPVFGRGTIRALALAYAYKTALERDRRRFLEAQLDRHGGAR